MYFGILKSVIYIGIEQCHCSDVLRGAGIGVQRCWDVLAIFVIQLMVVGVDSCKTGPGRNKS